jgi:hypothetical protein
MRIHLQQVHQSLNGAEHFMIDRAPQPPPRVLPGNNTNRNISDIVGIVTNPLPPPPPAALPTMVIPNTTVEGMNHTIVNTSGICTFGNSCTTTPSVTLTPVPAHPSCLNIPSTISTSSNTIGSVTLTPVNRSHPKSVTLTPLLVHQQQPPNHISNDAQAVSTVATTNFITSGPNTLTQLNSLSADSGLLPNTSLPNITLPSITDSSTITMIANSLPGINLTTTLNNSLSNPISMHHQNGVLDCGLNLPTSLTTSLPTFTFPSNFVSHLANSSSHASSIASLATSTNSLTNTMMMHHLPPTNICTTNPVNHTILTNVLNNVNEGTAVGLPPSSNHQLSSNPSTATVQISHPHNNVLSSNGIPLIVTKIEENAVH